MPLLEQQRPTNSPPQHRMLTLVAGVAMAVAASFAVTAEDAPIRVRIEGTAVGVGVCGRDAAVKNAERGALAQVIDAIVGEEHASDVASLLDKGADYLRGTRVLRHEEADGQTTVEIETYVRAVSLQIDAVTFLMRRLPWPPKVLVLVAERIGDAPQYFVSPKGVAQVALVEVLKKHSLEFADADAPCARYSQAELLERLQGDLDVAGRFAREHLVDVVVLAVAEANTDASASAGAMRRVKATLTARIFRAHDGKLLDAVAQEAIVSSMNPVEGSIQALQDACAKVRDAITVAAVLAAVNRPPDEDVVVTLQGLGGRERLDEVVGLIEGAPGVESVEELYCTEVEARLRIAYGDSLAQLVDLLAQHPFAGFMLESQRIVGRDMTFAVHSR